MTRALFGVLALVGCAASRPPSATSRVADEPTPPDAATTTPTESPTIAAPDAGAEATTDVPASAPPTPPSAPPAQAIPGSAAHCLYVGPQQRVVRCYWERRSCDEQIAFNKESGVDNSQECRGVAEAHCSVSDRSERCYPTADECVRYVASIRDRNRQATDCVAKNHP